MATIRGADEMYLQEARLERQYMECESLLESICTLTASSKLPDTQNMTEASIRAVRKLNGFWDRVVLLHQNGQLRADFFAQDSPWRERGRIYRQCIEPLDAKVRKEEGQGVMRRSRSGSYEGSDKRPERFKFLEEQEGSVSTQWRKGSAVPMTALLAERRAALRSIDIEALQARAAALGNRPVPAPWAASLAASNAAALARMPSHDAFAKQPQPKPIKREPAAGSAAAPPRRAASPAAGNATQFASATRRGAGAAQAPSPSPGTRNAPALARISRHDASAAQLQCQLAAEAAAFVSAGALRSTKNSRSFGISAAPSVEFPPVAGANPFAQAEAAAVTRVVASAPQRAASGEVSVMGSMPSVMLPALAGENPFAQASAAPAAAATAAPSAPLERTPSEEEMSKAGSTSSASLPALAVANPFAQAALHPTTEAEGVSQPAAAPPSVPPEPPTVHAAAHLPAQDAPVLQAVAAANGDDKVQEGTAGRGQQDQPAYSKPQPRRRSGSQPRTSLAVVKEHDAEQQWQHPLDDDSAEFYALKPAEEPPLVRMDSVPVYRANISPPASPFDRQTQPAAEQQIPATLSAWQENAKSASKSKPAPAKRSKAAVRRRLVRESGAEQQERNALDDDSAEFYVVRAAQQPLARMASSLAFEFPTLSHPASPAVASAQPDKRSSTSGSPPAEIKPAPVKSIKTAEVLRKGEEEVPATPRAASERGKALKEAGVGLAVPATPVKKPAAAAAWQPTTPGQVIEPPPAAAKSEWSPDSSAALAPKAAAPGPVVPIRVNHLVELLQTGAPAVKAGAAWALHDLAKGTPQRNMGDLVWESEGVLPLVAMLAPADSPQAIAAASAISQLASPINKAFQSPLNGAAKPADPVVVQQIYTPVTTAVQTQNVQVITKTIIIIKTVVQVDAFVQAIVFVVNNGAPRAFSQNIGVGEAGGLGKLLGMAHSDNPEAATAAAKALGGLVACNPVLQECLLDAEGAPVLVQLLDAPKAVHTHGKSDTGLGENLGDGKKSPLQGTNSGLDMHTTLKKQAAAVTALGNIARGFAPGQEEVAKLGAIPKMLALLETTSETVKERAAEALLAVIGKDVGNQQRLREAGGVASLLAVISRSATAARSRAAEHAAALLYRLTLYRCAHAELQESGCIEALVPLLNGENAVIKTHVIWAVHNLTAGGPETEEAIVEAGGVPALVDLIRSSAEVPDQAPMLQPATIALCNLAAGDEARRNAIVDAGALPVLVKLLSHQERSVAGHAARSLWNLTSKHAANQDAVRNAGAIPPLVQLLIAPDTIKGVKNVAVLAQEEAAGALSALARSHTENQEAVRTAGAIKPLLSLVASSTPAVRGQAAWALQALAEGNAACQAELHQAGGVAALTGLLHFPEQWNWTPVVRILKNLAAAEAPLRQALLADGTVPVLVDLLNFGRPILQVGAAETLVCLASMGEEANAAIREAGGVEKLKELCSSASVAPAAVKQAARNSLAMMGPKRKQRNKKDSKVLRFCERLLNFKLSLLGLPKV
ncbi:probable importin subunit alpha-1b at C-terminar half [Coccomyxa sp. Obi]|nr:probable importin subunit alpha-1b at C-terminar half [Coccomyxa sp. Obi]